MKHLKFLFSSLFPLMLSLDGDGGGGGGGASGGAGAGAAGGSGDGTAAAGAGGNAAAGAGTAAAVGQAGPLLDASGNFTPGWSKALGAPDTLEAKFTSPKALVASYTSLEKMISAKGIIKPGPNATPAETDAYYAALGRPAKPEEYGLAKPDKITMDGKEVAVPAEMWDAKSATEASALFHKLGLTKEQASALTQFDLERGMRTHSGFQEFQQKQATDAITALKTEWGDNYDKNLGMAKDAALKLGLTPEVLNANPALGNNPAFIKAMVNAGRVVLEAPAGGLRGNTHASLNPAAEIKAIMGDKNHPWHPHNAQKDPAGHKEAVAHMTALYKLKSGEA